MTILDCTSSEYSNINRLYLTRGNSKTLTPIAYRDLKYPANTDARMRQHLLSMEQAKLIDVIYKYNVILIHND